MVYRNATGDTSFLDFLICLLELDAVYSLIIPQIFIIIIIISIILCQEMGKIREDAVSGKKKN